MKIIIELNSLEELNELATRILVGTAEATSAEDSRKAEKSAANVQKTPKNEHKQPKTDKKSDLTATDGDKDPASEAQPDINVEDLRVETRKLLAKVNKMTPGENVAAQWIADAGYKKLTEIKDAAVLQGLKAKAEEALHD